MFRIKDSTDQIKAFRVSKDAVIAAVVLGSDEIHIYRVQKTLIFTTTYYSYLMRKENISAIRNKWLL